MIPGATSDFKFAPQKREGRRRKPDAVHTMLCCVVVVVCGMLSRMKRLCPICRKPADSQTDPDFPFCSERCRLIDLGNWSSEKYKISEPVIDESAPEAPPREPEQDEK